MTSRTWIITIGLALCLCAQPVAAGQLETGLAKYRHGHYVEAVSILKPLAHEGNPIAQFSIGVMYDDGVGLPRNYSLAFKWYLKAAKKGLVDAQFMVGKFYGTGRGMSQSPAKAYMWYSLAAAGAYPRADDIRDQQENEISPSQRSAAQQMAVSLQKSHPPQFSCKRRSCIHPRWVKQPWRLFEPNQD